MYVVSVIKRNELCHKKALQSENFFMSTTIALGKLKRNSNARFAQLKQMACAQQLIICLAWFTLSIKREAHEINKSTFAPQRRRDA